jgi:MerR family transcriptional regulator, light-induced transcriptional regulator
MASVFGFAELKSKIEGWRAGLASAAPRSSWWSQQAARHDPGANQNGPDDLSLLLENLVIPRLIAARDAAPPKLSLVPDSAVAAARPPAITAEAVADFADLAVAGEATALLDFADRLLAQGHSVECLYVDLLAPAARLLGENWEEDRRDFVEVTMGLWRIQEILRELGQRCPPALAAGQGQRRALFSPMPGDQHSLGPLMIADCFQRAGWDVDVLIEPAMTEINAKAAHGHYDLVGLTVTADCSSGALSGTVTAIRAVSANPDVRIFVGGRVINAQPELVAACKADASAADAIAALALADRLVPVRAGMTGNLV